MLIGSATGDPAAVAWERRARALANVIAVLRPDVGLHAAVQTGLCELTSLAQAARAALVVHDAAGDAIHRWELHEADAAAPAVTASEASMDEWPVYFFDSPAATIVDAPPHVRAALACSTVACFEFRLDAARGRLLVLDPVSPETADLAWVRDAVPPVAAAYMLLGRLRRLRRRAEAAERARLGRDLHDGPIQAFVTVRLMVAALPAPADGEAAAALGAIDDALQEAIDHLRALSDRARVGIVPPAAVVPLLRRIVDRFAADTGITARFETTVEAPPLSPRTAYELCAIVREALTNVARHSRATAVAVELSREVGAYRLRIDDNGRGAGALVPTVIAERAGVIGATLAVGPLPAGGTRVDVLLPGADRA